MSHNIYSDSQNIRILRSNANNYYKSFIFRTIERICKDGEVLALYQTAS